MVLGWSARFFSTDDRLEQAMNQLANTPDDEAIVVAELGRWTALDTQIAGTDTTSKATSVGAIELRAAYQLGVLRSRQAAARGRISVVLGVPVKGDSISGGGSPAFAGPYGLED